MNSLVPVFLCVFVSWGLVPGAAAADRALEIMREVERRQLTDSQSNDGAIEVVDSKGKVLNKSWRFTREGNRGRSKILIRFTAPPEVRDVGFLTLNHLEKPAEQWLYTPAIQRDRRVAPQEKSQRFMGTDFTHEDMEERSVENYDYDLVGEENLGGQPAHKIRAVYKDRDATQYSQLYLWVRKDIVATTYVEFYVDGKLRKTMRWNDWKQIQDIWTPHVVEMKDLARGSTTRVRVSGVKYNLSFEPDWFSLRNLRRAP
jgi:Outer membrane lipoprotein-sorting protein